MITVDARGLHCPIPIIETRKALRQLPAGESLQVLIDNKTSLGNVCKFLDDNKCAHNTESRENYWIVTVAGSGDTIAETTEKEYCPTRVTTALAQRPVIVLSSDVMGSGDEALGRKLMNSFVGILTELDTLPFAVLCYNGGVKLALPDSPASDTLAELEKRGVEVVLCGTCIDYYNLRGKTAAGKTGDMFRIASLMASATSVLKP